MREVSRRLLLLLCALAFFGGTTLGLGAHSAAAGEPCADYQHAPGTAPHHHGMDSGDCLTCCPGACLAIPDLPRRSLASLVPLTASPVAYWGDVVAMAGHAPAPDPTPPRTIG